MALFLVAMTAVCTGFTVRGMLNAAHAKWDGSPCCDDYEPMGLAALFLSGGLCISFFDAGLGWSAPLRAFAVTFLIIAALPITVLFLCRNR